MTKILVSERERDVKHRESEEIKGQSFRRIYVIFPDFSSVLISFVLISSVLSD